MKKGIHYWALPTTMNVAEKLRFAKQCGFDGVELVVLAEGEFSPCSSAEKLREIRNAADSEGIALPSITDSLNWTCSLTSDSRIIREKAENMLKQEIDLAYAIGAEAVLALPGFVSMNFGVNELHPATDTFDPENYHPSSETVNYADAYNRSLDAMVRIAPYAQQAGVKICVENIWSNFLLSPLEMSAYIDSIGSDSVRSYFDVGNVRPFGIPQHWIKILGSRIDRVHFKDYIDRPQSLSNFVPMGEGNIDFQSVMSALSSIGFDGWVTAELNVDPSNMTRIAMEASETMSRMFDMSANKG